MTDVDIPEVTFSPDMSNEDYHKHHALGSSNLKQILKNPTAFYLGLKPAQTQAMALGSAVHVLVLEPHKFGEEFAVMPDYNLRTNEGKNAKALFEMDNVGKTVIKGEYYDIACKIAGRIRTEAEVFLDGGVAEQAFLGVYCYDDAEFVSEYFLDDIMENIVLIRDDGVIKYYEDKRTGKKYILVKCKPDYYVESMGLVVDLKVVQDASPDGFAKQCANFGYHIQEALYKAVLRQNGKAVNKFLFVACEKEDLFMIGMHELGHVSADLGMSEVKRAFDIYMRLDEFKKPVYKDTVDGTVIQTIELPNWVFYAKGASL